MNALETAINTMTAGQKSEMTITSKAMASLAKKARRAHNEIETVEAQYKQDIKDAKFDLDQAQIAMKILSGERGYFVCTQFCDLKIESAFTAFEEICSEVGTYMISVSLEKPTPKLSQMVYEVAENGMMTLVDKKVDSSD